MSFALPWAALALAALPALWWLHRRARPAGDRPYSAFFLLVGATGGDSGGGRLRAPLLLVVRILAVVALVVAAMGPAPVRGGGTLVLAAGPVEPDPTWASPVVFVRAGAPATLADAPRDITPVDARPAWGAALLLGRRHAPDARVIRFPRVVDRRIAGAGAALSGDEVIVTAVVAGDGTPRLRVGTKTHAMMERNGDWFHRGTLRAGAALVEVGDTSWPVCIPDAGPLAVAESGWPPAVAAMLEVLPNIRRDATQAAAWRPGRAPSGVSGWAAFAPGTTFLEFVPGDRPAAPLFLAGPLPSPGAVARRWAPLSAPATPVLYAGDAVVADHREGLDGAARRFGFDPADTDLPDTAGWPVLFLDAVDADRAARARCRAHSAGRPLLLAASAPVTVHAPGGVRRTLAPADGRLVVDGLDTRGVHRLESMGRVAYVAVEPVLPEALEPAPELASPERARDPSPRWALAVALGAMLIALLLAARMRHPLAWLPLALAAVALAGLRAGAGEDGTVVVAVDVSGSMPAAETRAAVEAVQAALRGVPTRQIQGADSVRATEGALSAPSGSTRHAPLVEAAATLGDGGPVVLVSDGRAQDGPVAASVPVFTLPVAASGPDAWVISARAFRLGAQVFVHAEVAADRAIPASVELGGALVSVRLEAGRTRAVQAVVPAGEAAVVEVVVSAEGDARPENDRWPVPVEDPGPATAVVVGPGAAPWARAAGLRTRVLPAASIAEAGAQLAAARAVFIHDQPAPALARAVVPRVRRWVEAGGTLVLGGRETAFGPGGWSGTAVEALSPLLSDPRPPGTGRIAAVLLLDRSGSMATEAGGIGLEGVARIAGAVAAGLAPDDPLAVVAFGARTDVLRAPGPAGELDGARLPVPEVARGGTRFGLALTKALELHEQVAAEARVVIAVTDGRFVDPSDVAVPRAMLRARGARLVVVLVGADPDVAAVEALADQVVRADVDMAPRVATAAALVSGTGGLLADGGAVQPEAAWGARVGGTAPDVPGRVRVRARPQARVLARVGGEPVLAEWSVGQGRVIAIATDAWALGTDQWAALLSPAAAPRPGGGRVRVVGARLVFEGAVADPPPTGLARVVDAGGVVSEVAWRPDGPGRAWAPLPPGPVGVLEVESASARGAVVTRVTRPPPPELWRTGVDLAALSLQAELTGGHTLDGPQDVAAVRAARRGARGRPLAPWFALLAVIALLGEVAAWSGGNLKDAGKYRN